MCKFVRVPGVNVCRERMQGAGEMAGGERESMCACETKRGAEREGERRVLVCVLCVCVCFSVVIILIT